jgi:hypothetical protein
MRNGLVVARACLFATAVASLSGCGAGNGLPVSSAAPDLALPDLPPPPQTIGFVISELTGDGLSGDTTMMTFPLPTPTTVPVDGIDYIYKNLHAGQYDFTIAWLDDSDGNRGWTASFGGAPGITPGWPIMTKRLTMYSDADFGPDKVAFIAGAGALPNRLILTVRSVTNPQTDYGIVVQGVKGNRD